MFMLIPIIILLTVSFFVLAAASKVEAKGLKIFGWAICVLLWLAAALVLITAFTGIAPGPYGTGKRMFQCPIGPSRRSDPHHPWRNNPHKGIMMDDQFEGMMTDKYEMKCPGMQDMGTIDIDNKTK